MKTEKVTFNVSEDVLASLKVGVKGLEVDMRRYLALQYFKDKRLSMGKAAKLAGINRFEFMDFLASEGIVIYDYDTTAVDEELEGVKRLKELSL